MFVLEKSPFSQHVHNTVPEAYNRSLFRQNSNYYNFRIILSLKWGHCKAHLVVKTKDTQQLFQSQI